MKCGAHLCGTMFERLQANQLEGSATSIRMHPGVADFLLAGSTGSHHVGCDCGNRALSRDSLQCFGAAPDVAPSQDKTHDVSQLAAAYSHTALLKCHSGCCTDQTSQCSAVSLPCWRLHTAGVSLPVTWKGHVENQTPAIILSMYGTDKHAPMLYSQTTAQHCLPLGCAGSRLETFVHVHSLNSSEASVGFAWPVCTGVNHMVQKLGSSGDLRVIYISACGLSAMHSLHRRCRLFLVRSALLAKLLGLYAVLLHNWARTSTYLLNSWSRERLPRSQPGPGDSARNHCAGPATVL
jgi:hypothetical protein